MTSKPVFRLIGLVFCITAVQLLANGQAVPDPKAEQELNRKAQALLAEITPLTRQLKSRDNQILSRLALAELQWKNQEKLARQVYRETFDLVRQAWANLGSDDDTPYDEQSIIRLRDRVIESIARRDIAMARQLFEQMRVGAPANAASPPTEPEPSLVKSELAGYDRNLERSLATSAAGDNTDEMVRLIRKELDSEFSVQITYLLEKLAEKDPQKAGALMEDFFGKFRKLDLASNPNFVEPALFLLAQALSSSSANKKEAGPEAEKVIPLTPELSREIIEFVTKAALDKKLGPGGDYILSSLFPVIEKIEEVAPAQGARLKKKFAELEKQDDTGTSPARFQELAAKKEIAGMLDVARKAPAEMRDVLFSEAATTAWDSGDKTQANEIVEKNVANSFERNRMLRTFHDKAIAESIEKGDLAQARRLIQQTRSIEGRVGQLIDLASAYVTKSDKKAALEILSEAQTLTPVTATKQSELDLQISLANAFAKVDSDRSFALMSAAIDQINEITIATARVANFLPLIVSLKDGEFEIDSNIRVAGVDSILSREIRALAEADFEKTKKILDKFERPEIRIAAYLHLARTILEPEDCSCACPAPGAGKQGQKK